jgi:hypothetical protein
VRRPLVTLALLLCPLSAGAAAAERTERTERAERAERTERTERKERDGLLFVTPGYVYGRVEGASPATAHGFELSVHYLHPDLPIGVGAFAQLQRYDGDHNRFAGGAQVTFAIVGLEIGYAHRDAGSGPPASGLTGGSAPTRWSQTSGVHLAPFVSFGFVYFAYRWTIAVSEGPSPTHGSEHALTVGIKIPLQLRGPSVYRAIGDGFAAWR